jgi:hypothetical protein
MGPRLGLIITAGFLLVFLTPLNHASAQAEGDTDYDGLTDTEEITYYHTDPRNSDSDGDSIRDGDEVRIYHSNLLQSILMGMVLMTEKKCKMVFLL